MNGEGIDRFAEELKRHAREACRMHPDFGGGICVAREFADLVKADEAGDPAEVRRQCLHLAVTACRLALHVEEAAAGYQEGEEMKAEEKQTVESIRAGASLEDVPVQDRTPGMCLAAVERDGGQLRFVPAHMKTPDLCLEAVRKRGSALEHVPFALRREPVCLMAVGSDGMALDFVPRPMRTPPLCLAAVKRSGMALQLVPEGSKTEDVCLAALKSDMRALPFVPRQMRRCLLEQAGAPV